MMHILPAAPHGTTDQMSPDHAAVPLGLRAPGRHPIRGNLAASAITGILWTTVSSTAAFVFLAATMTAATGTLAVVTKHDSAAEVQTA
ncbi:MAG TPA: hypothetical protein VFM27_21435 [Acidimicrobiales bacterium]|nr:hypothetical protein [Acidimicrobiales bacterium]